MHKYVIEGVHVQFCSEYVLVSCSSEGFKCVFYSKFYSTKFLNSSSGTIFTPNWPLVYPQDTICTWTFNPPASKIVRLFFTSFELEEKQDCNPDRPVITGDDIRINGEFYSAAPFNNMRNVKFKSPPTVDPHFICFQRLPLCCLTAGKTQLLVLI